MSDFNDNGDTLEFNPVKEEKKPQVNRRENDEYSAARRNNEYKKREEKSSNTLMYIAIVLAVLLIITVVAGIFILKPKETPPEDELNQDNVVAPLPGEDEEEEKPKDITLSCSMVFYSDSVINKNGGYTILADLYDKDFYKFDNRKLFINSKTDIREDGKRLSADALIYLIESMGGEGIIFDGEINEEDGTVLSIKFDGSFREEMEKTEEEQPEEESPKHETPEQEAPEQNGNKEDGEKTPSNGNAPSGESTTQSGNKNTGNGIPADVTIGNKTE